jgi:hypothetical protein
MLDSDQREGQPRLTFGFLSLRETAAGIRCGLLVTDAAGVPKEFRATEPPVRPTPVQRILYGASLCRQIARLSGCPLIAALDHTPTWILADSPDLLWLGTAEVPIVMVKAHGEEEVQLEPSSREGPHASSEDPVTVGGGAFRPVTISFAPQMKDVEERQLRARFALAVASCSLDLLEPFERVRQALEVLDRQAAKA